MRSETQANEVPQQNNTRRFSALVVLRNVAIVVFLCGMVATQIYPFRQQTPLVEPVAEINEEDKVDDLENTRRLDSARSIRKNSRGSVVRNVARGVSDTDESVNSGRRLKGKGGKGKGGKMGKKSKSKSKSKSKKGKGKKKKSRDETFSPFPTQTPFPTATPFPTITPVPTETPLPSWTPLPTWTPFPSFTPFPTEEADRPPRTPGPTPPGSAGPTPQVTTAGPGSAGPTPGTTTAGPGGSPGPTTRASPGPTTAATTAGPTAA